MAAVVMDIVEGAGGKLTRAGWEFDRIALVSGVTGAGYARAMAAAAATGMPALYSVHPAEPNTVLVEIAPEAETGSVYRVRLTYRNPAADPFPTTGGPPRVTRDCSLQEVETSTRPDGSVLLDTFGEQTKVVTVRVPRPQRVITIERTVTDDPAWMEEYSGAVNLGGWQYDVAAATGQWICEVMTRSDDGEESWIVTLRFSYREETWIPRTIWRDESGNVPVTATATNWTSLVQQMNFDILL